jgi:hypothetical protein
MTSGSPPMCKRASRSKSVSTTIESVGRMVPGHSQPPNWRRLSATTAGSLRNPTLRSADRSDGLHDGASPRWRGPLSLYPKRTVHRCLIDLGDPDELVARAVATEDRHARGTDAQPIGQ